MKREAARKPETDLPASPSRSEKLIWEQVGSRLVSIREQSNTDRPGMARALGVSVSTYGRFERGDREIGAKPLALLGSMGWNLNWVVRGNGAERLEAAFQSQSQDLSPTDLSMAIQLANEKIAASGLAPTPEQYGQFVLLLYKVLEGGLPNAEITDFPG